MKRYLVVALTSHFLLHAYLSAAVFMAVSYFLPIDRYAFALLTFLVSGVCELYDHLKKNFNYMGDRKSAVREVLLLSLSILFICFFEFNWDILC